MTIDVAWETELTDFLAELSGAQDELLDVLNRWSGTGLIATHDLEFVRLTCRRVLVMNDGKLVADGETDAILGDAMLMESHGLEVPASLR